MEHQHSTQIYTCHMHPQILQDAPGKCPLCGMILEPIAQMNVAQGKHDHHSGMIADFKKRFYIVLALTVPIMLLSPMIQQFMGVNWQFSGSNYILLALSTLVFLYGGMPFLKGLVDEVKAKNPGMMF